MRKKIRLVLLIVGVILLLDQASKALVVHHMTLYQSEPVVASFFHLNYVRNTGAAFGFLAQTPAWFRQPFFLGTTVIAVFALGIFLRNADETDRMTNIAVATILGGALGNMIDRIQDGSVIDFLDFHWHGYHGRRLMWLTCVLRWALLGCCLCRFATSVSFRMTKPFLDIDPVEGADYSEPADCPLRPYERALPGFFFLGGAG